MRSWGPEEWDAFTLGVSDEDAPSAVEAEAVHDLLSRLPGRRRMTVADLGCGRGDWIPFLKDHFGQVVALDFAPASLATARRVPRSSNVIFRRRDMRDLTPFRASIHVALMIESLVGPNLADVDRVLGQVHGALVEGGILVATAPARTRRGKPVPMALHGGGRQARLLFTETDLQYRLRRAGFLGVLIRRFQARGGRPEMLLVVASKRANN